MAGRWDGATLFMSRDGGTSYQELDTDQDPGSFGIALTVLAAGTATEHWDDVNTVDIQLTQGTDAPPVTMSDNDVLAGKNGLVLGDEYLQYGTVVSLGSNQYRLSHLLRGRRGTDFYWGKHQAGERAVLDNGGVKRFLLPSSLLGTQIRLKAVPFGLQEPSVTSYVTVTVYGRETLEYSPCNLTGSRDGSNNLTIGFTRRARKNGDMEDYTDVPLDVTTEAYEVLALSAASTSITAVTRALQAVVTVPGHAFSVGQKSYFNGVAGMLELNGMVGVVQAINVDDVTFDIDSRQFTAYASGGNTWRARRVISANTESASYSAANQTLDFGTTQNPLQIAVYALGNDGRAGYATAAFV